MSGAGLKKCMPTTRSGVDVADAISVTESADVFVASTVSARQMRSSSRKSSCFGLELLDDRLDHEVAVGEIGELRGEREPPDGGVARGLRRADPSRTLRVRKCAIRSSALLAELERDLATDRLESRLDAELCDAAAHRAQADDTDLLVQLRHDVTLPRQARAQRRDHDPCHRDEPERDAQPHATRKEPDRRAVEHAARVAGSRDGCNPCAR